MEQEVLDAPITSAVEIYNPIAAGIALMLARHGHILTSPPVIKDDPAALATTKAGRQELVKFRTTLEKARKAEKAESLAYGRLVDSEAARIQAFADPLELAYDKMIDAEEARLEAICQAELEAERQRIAHHRVRIQSIKEVRETANMCRTADRLKQLIAGMPTHLEQPFEEFQGEAETAFNEVCTVLQQLHSAKVEAETQAAELKRQQEELARQRAEQAAKDLAASQARAAEEAAAQARRMAEEEDFAHRRAEFERQAQAHLDALAAQQAEIEAQKAALAPVAVEAVVETPAEPQVCEIVQVADFCKPADPEPVESSPPTLRLGQINAHLAPIQINSDGLRWLGFEPVGKDRAAVLYHASSLPQIKAALVKHLSTLPALLAE